METHFRLKGRALTKLLNKSQSDKKILKMQTITLASIAIIATLTKAIKLSEGDTIDPTSAAFTEQINLLSQMQADILALQTAVDD